jgi:hypothetical protein
MPRRRPLDRYRAALREEPRMRNYLGASIVDDVGVAVTAWATALLLTDLFTDQRERARLMLPTLLCFLAGNVVAGPLADWAGDSLERLARWRWRVVLAGRAVETLALGLLVWGVASGPPSAGRVLPFMMVSAFMKTALRPTRLAFEVDLLGRDAPQFGPDGQPLLDERGEPRRYKTHLLPMSALTSALRAGATLLGLVLGGRILGAVRGAYWPLFAFDVLTNLGFIAVVLLGCHPARTLREAGARGLVGELFSRTRAAAASRRAPVSGVVRRFATSVGDGARFLARRDQRPLLALLAGTCLVELASEMYDGRMIVRRVLHGGPTALRHAELSWAVVGVLGALLLPVLARCVGSLGRVFLATMLLDGVVLVVAGRVAGLRVASAVVPFAAALAVDRSLTLASGTLADLAQNSASSAAMRGRIAAFYGFVVLAGDIVAEIVATAVSEAIGVPAMLVRVGIVQVGLVALIALGGGRALWRFGLRTPERATDASRPSRPSLGRAA